MSVSKSRLLLNGASFLVFLIVTGMFLFASTDPFAAVFLMLKTGTAVCVAWLILFIVSGVSLVRNRRRGLLKAGLPLAINLLTVLVVLVYVNHESSQYLSDSDIVVNRKELSPDGTHEILEYMYDIGALGYTSMFTAIVPVNDESTDLSRYRLPMEYKNAQWLGSDSIEVEVDIRPFLAKRKEYRQDVFQIGSIKIAAQTRGFDTSSPLFVEHRALSPDGRRELVAYRYRDHMESGHLHISVINDGEAIPALGNLYIGNQHNDYVYFGEWRTSDTIVLYTESKYLAEQYVLDHAGVTVELTEEELADSGVSPGWYHKPPYGSEHYLEDELKQNGRLGTAAVVDKFYYADGRMTGTKDVLYTYDYNGKTYSALFREKEVGIRTTTNVGDRLQIMFSSSKPDVHKIVR